MGVLESEDPWRGELSSGFLALAWRDRWRRAKSDARGFFRLLVDRDLHRRLLGRRRALVDELTALALLVPDAVRRGEPKEE